MKRILLTLAALSAACNASNPSTTNAVIGKNDLAKPNKIDTRLGIINTSDRRCNAFQTAPDELTTALHCVGDDPHAFVGFVYQDINGSRHQIVDISFLDDRKDLVSYRIDGRFASHFEFGVLDPEQDLQLLAIAPEGGAQLSSTCQLELQLQGASAFAHKCDTTPKFSGAPILQAGKVVGVHVGTSSGHELNYATNIAQIHDDEADIAALENQIELEWPHIRSPHIRSPHIRSDQIKVPAPVGVSGYPFWGDRGGACGSGWSKYIVPDHWGIPGQLANFSPACQNHDDCYKRQGGQLECDNRMRSDLINICNATFKAAVFSLQKAECRNVVTNVYYRSVRASGAAAYSDCRDGSC